VINIITKSSEATQGAMIEAGGGSQTEANTGMRYGGRIGSNATYRVIAHYGNQGSFALNDPLVTSRGWANRKLGFRVDWKPAPQDTLMFSGDGYVSDRGHTVQTHSAQNPFPPVFDIRENFNTADLEGRWQHAFSDNSSIETRVSWTHTHREDFYDPSASNKVDLDFQHHVAFGRNDLIWGVNLRKASYTMLPGAPSTYRVVPMDSSEDAYAGFFEDEFALVQTKLYFIAGMQVSHNQFTGVEVQPTGRLMWTPTKKLSRWAAVSRAVRTPTILERGFDAILGAFPAQPPLFGLIELIGSPTFRSEPMTSYEVGQRMEIAKRVSLDASAFMSFYQRLETTGTQPKLFVPPSAAGPAQGIIGNSPAGVPPIRSHLRGDLRLGWRPNAKLEFSGGVQNAFDPNHLEFGSPRVLAGSEVPRNVYASLKFYF
jgi:iron complex outermembrane receptor protein